MTDLQGHNKPPDMTATAVETMRDLSDWMAENPVIQSMENAREAKVFIDRAKLCIKDLEDERDGKVRPLNEQVKEINAYYKGPRSSLETVLSELNARVAAFVLAEERKREAAAREAARIAAEAEARAREAERLEQEALASAASGELGVDVAAHVTDADDAFKEYERANRQAALAERETHVKIGGGFSRSISLRSKETLVVTDPIAALNDLGLTEDISEAIVKTARAYRKLRGKLPTGVISETREEL